MAWPRQFKHRATRFSVLLWAWQGLQWGRERRSVNSPNLLSCQANVRMRLRSFLHYATGMLGDAPEIRWGLAEGQVSVITLPPPPAGDPQKEKEELIFSLIKTKTKPSLLWG